MKKHKTIYLDFDGTMVEHKFPKVGHVNIGSIRVVKSLNLAGHRIILNSMRVHVNTKSVLDALDFFKDYGIDIKWDSISSKKIPTPWSQSLKSDEVFIDDEASGIPLKKTIDNGHMVDWEKVENDLIEYGIL